MFRSHIPVVRVIAGSESYVSDNEWIVNNTMDDGDYYHGTLSQSDINTIKNDIDNNEKK